MCRQISQRVGIPPHRLPLLVQRIGKQLPQFRGQIGFASFGLRAGGSEIDEPVLEDRPRHRLQRLVHPAVQVDLVVQIAEDVGDGLLAVQRRKGNFHKTDIRFPQPKSHYPIRIGMKLPPNFAGVECVIQVCPINLRHPGTKNRQVRSADKISYVVSHKRGNTNVVVSFGILGYDNIPGE